VADDLALDVRLLSAGVTLLLEQAPYSLHPDSRSSAAATQRAHKVSSPYVEGEFTVHAVRDNIVEPLAVWIEAADRQAFQVAKKALEDAVSQPQFTVQWHWGRPPTNGVLRETWKCFAAGYTLETSQPLMTARMGLFKIQVPRLPTIQTAVVNL
jgi:hypothetical protein